MAISPSLKLLNERVNAVAATVRLKLLAKHTTPEKEITDFIRAELIRNGSVRLRAGVTEVSRRDDVFDVFDFSEYERDEAVDTDAYEAEYAAFAKKMNAVRDKAILGNYQDAVLDLQALEREYKV